jgi:PKD repeat protein
MIGVKKVCMKLFFRAWFVSCIILAVVIGPFEADAQVMEKGTPRSFQIKEKSAQIIPVLALDSVKVQQLLNEDIKFSIDNRYGVVQQCDINIKEAGVKIEVAGNGNIWRYKIESKNAYSLGILFKDYHLPKGASVFVYDESKLRVKGAFTQRNNNASNQLSLAEFPGKSLIVEYFEPDSPEFSGELVLGAVSQAYVDLQSTVDTRIGINCTQGANWQGVKTAICLMTFSDTYYDYYCTGSLLNNVKEDGTPYFLTANHCISTAAEASTLVTYFNYENSTCSSGDASLSQTLSGATFKSGSSYSDFSLLLLNEYPPDEYNPFYLGWDATGASPTSGVCIHHPEGTSKCIAVEKDKVTSYAQKISWTDDSDKITSTTQANTHWLVVFNEGNTEAGSSGSPFLDQNKRVVGQLHGGSDTESFYGKFSLSWNYSSTYTKQLAHWLDPENTGTKILDGVGRTPPVANFSAESQNVCVNNPVLFSDESKYRPTAWLWRITPETYQFVNGTDSTSQNPEIVFLEDGLYTVELHASNKYGNSELIQKNCITAKSKLAVAFYKANSDSVVCGCSLDRFPLVAQGAMNYSFKVSGTSMIDTEIQSDTLFLTLNASANGAKSFDAWVKVTGTFGACSSSDSILLHVIIQPNDNIAHAAKLSLGRNTGFSNRCATVESNEPSPPSTGCLVENSWCPNSTGSSSILDNSIWFTFISPSNGFITIKTSGFDDQIAVYQASSSGSILSGSSSQYTIAAANDNSSSSDDNAVIENLALEPLTQYWLQLDGNNAVYGDVVIDLISNSLEVYPNPSTGIFNLIVSNPFAGNADVHIFNMQGQQLYANQYSVNINSNKLSIDLSGLAKGVYLLNVNINGSRLSKKLILL